MDDDETNSGSIDSDGYNSYNVPEGIFHHQNNGWHWVENIYWKLNIPLRPGTPKKENICIPCCCSLDVKPRDAHARKKFVKSIALENMKKHIKKMNSELIPDEPSIQQVVAKKQANYKGAASIYMVKFMKPSLKQHKVDITRWRYLNGIPFNVSTSTEFWSIQQKHYNNYAVLSWIKFNDNIAHDYRRFVNTCA